VIPADENIPIDLARAISNLNIKVRRFRLKEANGTKLVGLE
jgi:hypothetical protein